MRISSIGLIAAVSLGLGGCAYGGIGMGAGPGYGYDNYGYGYDRYAYDRYAYGGYNPYGYNGYGSPYGWYNGYYYPGTGGWVYDRDGRRREISRDEQAHFGRLTDLFREGVKNRSSGTTTSTSSRAAVTTSTQAPAPARTRVRERTERPAVSDDRPRSGAARVARALRDRKRD
jgi:hypothetical protein